MIKQKSVIILISFAWLTLLLGGTAVSLAIGQTTSGENGVAATGTTFTYQGRLANDDGPANGDYDFEFRLYTAAGGEDQVGSTAVHSDVVVSDGLFTLLLDFGTGVFNGEARYLEIRVRPSDGGGFVILDPRQPLTAAPTAIYSHAAPWAGLIGIPDGFADGIDDDTLADLSCSSGEVTKWDGSAWVCAADDNTQYNAGTGLSLNGTTFDVNFAGSGGALTVAHSDHDHTGVYAPFTHNHDNRYYTKTELNASGGGGQVHWDNLTNVPSNQGSSYANVLVVAQSGGNFSSVQAALDSITDAAAHNPYLVYVAPGVYTGQVMLKPYVTLEGAGQGATILRGTGGSQAPSSGSNSATLVGANNAALRHLTIESDGAGQDYAIAIHNNNASPAITHVTATAYNSTINYSIYNNSSASPLISEVMAISTDGSIISYGMYNNNSSPTIRNSTIIASSSNFSYGIYNNGSSPAMVDLTIIARDSTNSFGVHNANSSTMMTNVTVTATSVGNNSTGVFHGSSSSVMTNVTAVGTGGSVTNYGAFINTSSSATIRNSQFQGATNSISRLGSGTAQVANSQLIGPVASGLICFNNYDANLNQITCP